MNPRLWRQLLREDGEGVGPTERLVALVLSGHVEDGTSAYLSRATLARGCGLSVRTVQRALPRLVAAGWLTVADESPMGFLPNRYELSVP